MTKIIMPIYKAGRQTPPASRRSILDYRWPPSQPAGMSRRHLQALVAEMLG